MHLETKDVLAAVRELASSVIKNCVTELRDGHYTDAANFLEGKLEEFDSEMVPLVTALLDEDA